MQFDSNYLLSKFKDLQFNMQLALKKFKSSMKQVGIKIRKVIKKDEKTTSGNTSSTSTKSESTK